jgi:signal transduction histidine kinase
MVSHDMRNPLATLKGTVMLLDPKILREEDLANIKKDIGDKIEGLSAVIINLLDWSKSQLSGETTVPEPFNLKVIGQQMLELFADPAQKKGIEVLNNFPKEIRLFADVNQVRTIFRNLIGNALKFSESGDTIELNVEIDNDMAIIEVKDTGLGMDQNKINSLFSLETNISTPGTSGEKGVGLGTLLIKEFVEKNSGKVWVDSKEGQGTSVFFTLKLFNEELS